MAGIAKQVIGSFSDIGQELVRDTASVPTEIMGKAMESLGAGSSKQGQQTQNTQALPTEGPVADIGKTTTEQAKKAIARSALEQLLGGMRKAGPAEEYERKKAEEQQAEAEKKKAEAAKMGQLPTIATKAKRGDLHGIKAKRSTEISKNTRQD